MTALHMENSRILYVTDAGKREYLPVWELQKQLVNMRLENKLPDTLLLVEHEPVYTLGRNASEKNVLASETELVRHGIRIVRTDRGGDVTYHGPGQIVGYPIISLRERGKGPVWYVSQLEAVLVLVLQNFGLNPVLDSKRRGVWIGNDKIAAIGVRITRGITMHGFALNVVTDLSNYRWIIPCGIQDRGVTSMHLLVPSVSIADVKKEVIRQFCKVFNYREVVVKQPEELENL
jgi:lipoyl(octanoyl) transferase